MNFHRLDDLDLQGKKVLIRVDFNVPLENGKVADDFRLRAHVPTIQRALSKGASVVLASHLGRPEGKADPKFSLKPLVEPLSGLLGKPVAFASDCVGPEAEKAARELPAGGVLLLENLRFHPEEEKNDEGFARKLLALCDAYVNDAFATAHRAHASVEAAARLFPGKSAGLLLEKEIDVLSALLLNPIRPLVAVIGGAKISTKIGVLKSLAAKVDALLVGGAMANTFLGALGFEVGSSLTEPDKYDLALEILETALDAGVQVLLPVDLVCSAKGQEGGVYLHTMASKFLTPDVAACDIGPETRARFARAIEEAGTVVWNGPMGLFEQEAFLGGTLAVAQAVASCQGLSIVGGGETVEAMHHLGLAHKVGHLSTGGGAFLEWLEGRKLPGIEVLKK
ncbi:MAG: phosphoglycerate kinase [Bdellovibrionota bacterium]